MGQECLALTDAQVHHDFLRAAFCWLTKGKITPDIVLVGTLKCEVTLELSCGTWYGLVCKLSQFKIWLNRLWCGSWEGAFLTCLLGCRWAGSPWNKGGDLFSCRALECRCLPLWTARAGSLAVPTFVLGWCRDLFSAWEGKTDLLKPGVLGSSPLLHPYACMSLPAWRCGKLVHESWWFWSILLTVAFSVGDSKTCCVWHAWLKETMWTDAC